MLLKFLLLLWVQTVVAVNSDSLPPCMIGASAQILASSNNSDSLWGNAYRMAIGIPLPSSVSPSFYLYGYATNTTRVTQIFLRKVSRSALTLLLNDTTEASITRQDLVTNVSIPNVSGKNAWIISGVGVAAILSYGFDSTSGISQVFITFVSTNTGESALLTRTTPVTNFTSEQGTTGFGQYPIYDSFASVFWYTYSVGLTIHVGGISARDGSPYLSASVSLPSNMTSVLLKLRALQVTTDETRIFLLWDGFPLSGSSGGEGGTYYAILNKTTGAILVGPVTLVAIATSVVSTSQGVWAFNSSFGFVVGVLNGSAYSSVNYVNGSSAEVLVNVGIIVSSVQPQPPGYFLIEQSTPAFLVYSETLAEYDQDHTLERTVYLGNFTTIPLFFPDTDGSLWIVWTSVVNSTSSSSNQTVGYIGRFNQPEIGVCNIPTKDNNTSTSNNTNGNNPNNDINNAQATTPSSHLAVYIAIATALGLFLLALLFMVAICIARRKRRQKLLRVLPFQSSTTIITMTTTDLALDTTSRRVLSKRTATLDGLVRFDV